MASLSPGAPRGGSRSLMAAILPRGGRDTRPAPARRRRLRSGDLVLDLLDEAAAVVRDDAGRLLGQAGRLAELLRDLGDLLGRVVRGEHVGLRRQVDRRGALGRVVDDLEILARLRVRAVE